MNALQSLGSYADFVINSLDRNSLSALPLKQSCNCIRLHAASMLLELAVVIPKRGSFISFNYRRCANVILKYHK